MLKVRVIPTLLYKNTTLVKGVAFDSWRRVGTALPAVRVYNMREVDELIFLDIAATSEDRGPDIETIRSIAPDCFVPLTVGGGISSLDHIRDLLLNGADKVAINTAAYENPELIRVSADRFGTQCIVVSVDVRRHPDGRCECYSNNGTKPEGVEPAEWAQRMERLGAGEILVTSVERDGTMSGYDVEMIADVARAVSIPVIASGGAGNPVHMIAAVRAGSSAVAAASMFHFTEQTPLEMKAEMARAGIAVRNTRSAWAE